MMSILVIVCSAVSFCQTTPPQPAPDIRVDYFGAEKGYVVGTARRNNALRSPKCWQRSAAGQRLRVRCYALAGLDYTEGELTPLVPPLQPQQAAAFRWRLQPTERTATLVASVLLSKVEEKPASVPDVNPVFASGPAGPTEQLSLEAVAYVPKAVVSVVPHLVGSTPDIGAGFAVPTAISSANSARIGNDRLILSVAPGLGHTAVGFLSAKSAGEWETVGVAWPLVQIRASDDGQSPWWRNFHWSHSESHTDPGSASLDLYGTCGDTWEAQISLETHKDSGVLNGRLRLKARKTCRLFGVQLPRLISAVDRLHPFPAADGSSSLVIANSSGDEADNLAAAHKGLITSGIAWPSRSPLSDWAAFPLPRGDTDHTEQLGMQWAGGERGEVVLPGGIVDFSFRIFCLAPSDNARDAHRFVIP